MMKKICSILLAIILLAVPMTIGALADGNINPSEQKILDELSKEVQINGHSFIIPKDYVNQASNYFKTIDLTESQALEVLGFIKQGEELLLKQDINTAEDVKKLPVPVKQEILNLSAKAILVTKGSLSYDGRDVTLKNEAGQVVFDNAPIIKQTGAQTDISIFVFAFFGVIAILSVAAIVAKKAALYVK